MQHVIAGQAEELTAADLPWADPTADDMLVMEQLEVAREEGLTSLMKLEGLVDGHLDGLLTASAARRTVSWIVRKAPRPVWMPVRGAA
uniref:hypothetical protein n=1 Tax=Actinokineospora sp. CA-119265 TaxID=3239890 RepID=UPI003F49287F